jgi:Fe-S-cluster formation regulator IscX/YfhJ
MAQYIRDDFPKLKPKKMEFRDVRGRRVVLMGMINDDPHVSST